MEELRRGHKHWWTHHNDNDDQDSCNDYTNYPRPDDFVAQLLIDSICLRTGDDTILPVIMFPKEYKHFFMTIPTLEHLWSLLIKLPPLTPHPSWSAEWIMDCPLRRTLRNGTPGGENVQTSQSPTPSPMRWNPVITKFKWSFPDYRMYTTASCQR